jgi:hypothetical protein
MRRPTTTITKKIPLEEFHNLLRPFVGSTVSRTWRGYGSAAFFELGELSPRNRIRRDGSISTSLWGQATIDLEIGWRVERPRSVFFGSSSSDRRIDNCLRKLQGSKIVSFSLQGRLPELMVELSGGLWLHSFVTWEGQPDWTIFFNDNPRNRQWLMWKRGGIVLVTSEAD